MQLDLVSVRGPILFDTAFLADSLRQLLHRSETALQVWSHVAPWAALLVLAGLVIRLPVFPCLGWFHSAATSAPIGISILMTTVIPLAAVSEWLRLGMPLFGLDQGMVSGTLGLLSLAGLWQNVLVLRSETDVKRMLIAISSAMLCVSGIALSFQQFDAIRGAWLLVVSQGLAIGGGLLIAQYLQARAGTCDLRRIGDQMAQSRQLSEMLTLVLLFWAGVPLIGVAAALTLIFSAVPADSVWLAIAMSVGLVLVAIASLSAITRLATVVGHDKAAVTGIGPEAHGLDLTASEWLAVIPFFGLLVFVNVSPELFLKPCRPGFLRAAQVSKQAATTQNAIRSSGSPRQSLPLTARTVAGTARP